MIGSTLGGYRIVEQIGQGGMATVFKAFDPSTERYVAIKTLPQQYLKDETFRARFDQEAKAIARLEHVHILPMFAFGEEEGIAYMVMRYLDTGTLGEYIQRHGALPFDETSQILTQVASALTYAHENNVLHRDIKPSNILMDNQGNAFLTDFGIAKMVDGSGLDLTGTGLIGTPKYMSPEQCLGKKDLTQASDQYALGIILYEMVTGQIPFDAETPLAVIQKHVSAPLPPPRSIRRDLPEAAQNILLKALSREPDARYQSCVEFANAFDDAIRHSAHDATQPLGEDLTFVPSDEVAETLTDSGSGSSTTVMNQGSGDNRRNVMIGSIALVALVILIVGAFSILGGDDDDNSGNASDTSERTEVANNEGDLSTATDEPAATNTNEPEPTATYTDLPEPTATNTTEPTDEPTATETPTPEPSPVIDRYTLMNRVETNDDWQPVIRTFDYNGYGVPMALVPRGCFTMGNDVVSAYYDDRESEVWQIGIPNGGLICFNEPFWIDLYEVSNEQFDLLGGEARLESNWDDPELPRERLTWYEAIAFCQDSRGGRLLTEAEWEYAARGPENYYYTWSSSPDMYEPFYQPPLNYCEGSCFEEFSYSWADRERNDRYGATSPVGTYANGRSWVGAYDLNGNVWEWTSTIYDLEAFPYPYDVEDGREDLEAESVTRAVRGGAYEGTVDKFEAPHVIG